LPEGWKRQEAGGILRFEYGKGLPARSRRNGNVGVYASAGRVGSHDEALVAADVIVIGRKGAAGNVYVASGPAWVIDTAYYVEAPECFDIQFLAYQLEAANLAQFDQSTAIPSLSRDDLNSMSLVVPPRDEQERIVRAIQRQLASISVAEQQLAQTLRLRDDYRAACLEGTSGSSLDGGHFAPLEEVAVIQTGIAKGRPGDGDLVELPYIRTANVQAGWLELDEIKTLRVTAAQRDRYRLQAGDVLVLEGGDADKVGRGWIWEGQIEECLHQNHVFAVRPQTEQLLPRYLAYYINAPAARKYFLSVAKQTTNLASINKTNLKGLHVPVPPIAEQAAAIRYLDRQMQAASELGARLRVQQIAAGRLRRAVLRHGITGAWSERRRNLENAV
jgi:type I restriction enzyme S subunit